MVLNVNGLWLAIGVIRETFRGPLSGYSALMLFIQWGNVCVQFNPPLVFFLPKQESLEMYLLILMTTPFLFFH